MRTPLIYLSVFLAGLAAGVYLQHRWPVGRWGEDTGPTPLPAGVQVNEVAALPASRRLVIVIAGQSNAANYGSVRSSGGPGVYVFHQGNLLLAQDPLPGADQYLGSPWPRLGAALKLKFNYEAVVFASLARGSSRASDWAPGGRLHTGLQETLAALQAGGLPADFILWQQGETEGWSPWESGTDYLNHLSRLIASTRSVSPNSRWVIAQASYARDVAVNAQIRQAQLQAGHIENALSGPDLDTLEAAYRKDGVHLNGAGLEAAAGLWLKSLAPHLETRPQP